MKNRYCKVMMNSLLGGVIAMGFGTTGAYADDGKTSATTERATVTISANAGAATSDTMPVLVSGHPFYILKILIENIEVVLKTDDVTENEDTDSDVTVIDTKDASEAASKAHNEAQLAETVHDDDDDEDKDNDNDNVITFEIRLKHNIEALMTALEHVKNPTARAALTRNIEKSLKKSLEKSLVTGELSVEAGDVKGFEEVQSEQAKIEKKSAHEQAKAAKKAEHEQAKAAKKAAREQAKAAKKAAHEPSKASKKAGH